MKEKNMWKELLNRAGWILVFLLAVLLYQVPLVVTSILTLKEVALLQSGLIVAGLSIVVLALFIMGARKTKLASFNFSFFRAKDLARLGLSYLVIVGSNILGSILLQMSNETTLLQMSNETTTANQSQINDMVQNSSLISSFFLLALLAPICEEILCRGIVPKKIFRGKESWGFVVGTIVFALLHQPSNLPSLLIYGGMSTVLSWTAYKTQRLEMSILLHMIVNGIAFCLLALVVIMSRTLGISV
ncbi:TPA: lysostaphin resistance A-like protein [Streptococcus pneumoniae]|uniref:CPBP family intramembrane glutamic endopeptidase n=1 Tax=Streptococcus pneumoniae TaxID=1313 RepID=UPI000B6A1928|nr:CPBP family intramembrane glutamic endopeptidase [Streptococcus pneumoniae]MBW7499728.1 CPBP family intramembrane metalloprotease [Streptococcus pneumoniae]MDV8191624.1 CPBP family intramembrane metalloprotease [Streptococcus pneumoniae]MDV8555126.1 CPBP family intramembrane metalloprotease [Streptococcus pneumoniae]MDV8611562.1 CPBP family intramembrane metalloprotease [Streptococcus pneumoniae]MDV8905265.1 CPBP family intramembrane metalloprotease [Streptococcus pneumoniae]